MTLLNRLWDLRVNIRPLIRQLFAVFLFFYLLALLIEKQWPAFYASTVGIDFFLFLTFVFGVLAFMVGREKIGILEKKQGLKKNIFLLILFTLMVVLLVYGQSVSLGIFGAIMISSAAGITFFLLSFLALI